MNEPLQLGPLDLLEPIGRGAWSEVWYARHQRTGRQVAVKVLTSRDREGDDERVRFHRELRAFAVLDHPGIVQLLGFGEVDEAAADASGGRLRPGRPYMVLEFVAGVALSDLVDPLPFDRLRHLLLELLDGLSHAHARGVVHRDLKPANVLLADGRAKLTDFGVARPTHDSRGFKMTRRTDPVMVGTPHYMAPEQIEGRWRDQGPWTDLYSLGCMAFELCNGRPPFDGATVMTTLIHHVQRPVPPLAPRIGVPDGFEAWVRRLLEKSPARRYRRAADAAWDLLGLSAAPPRSGRTGRTGAMAAVVIDETTPEMPVPLAPTALTSTWEGFPVPPTVDDLPFHLDDGLPVTAEAKTVRPRHTPLPDGPLPSPAGGPPLPRTWRAPGRPSAQRELSIELFGLRPLRLVGREPQRDALWGALREVWATGTPRLVGLTGPRGCGKSSLLAWLAERVHELGVGSALVAHHGPVPSPTDGLRRALAGLLGCEGLPPDEVEARVGELLARHGADSAELRAAYAALLCEGDRASPLSSFELRTAAPIRFDGPEERHALLCRCLGWLSRERPLVLGLDDVIWGADALSFVEALLEHCEPLPVLVVVTASDEGQAEQPWEADRLARLLDRPGARQLRVGPLTGDERAALMRESLHLDPAVARRVEARAEGNPMFAVQLVSDWIHRGLLEPAPNGLRLVADAEVPLPDSLHEVWSARVGRLLADRPLDDARALEVAAALGREVHVPEWTSACRALGVHAAPDLLDRLLAERLAVTPTDRADASRFSFVHGMLRESLERRAADAGRSADVHLAIARMLAAEDDPALLDRVGYHLAAAGQRRKALKPLLIAARTQLEAGEFERARTLLAERERHLDAEGLASDARARVDGWLLQARLATLAAEWPEAEKRASRAAETAARKGWKDAAVAGFLALAQVAHATGRLAGAWRLAEDAESWAMAARDDLLLAEARYMRGRVMLARGALEAATAAYRQALDGFEHAEDLYQVAQCLEGLGEVALAAGRPDEARASLTTARQHFLDCGARLRVARCSHALGEAARLKGDLLRAEVFYREALERYERVGALQRLEPRLSLGLVRLARGELAKARPFFEAVAEAAEEKGLRPLLALAHAALMPCAIAEGDWSGWRDHLGRAARILGETGYVDQEVARVARRAGELALTAGAPARAREAWLLARDHWRGLGRADEADEVERLIAASRS